MPDNSIFVCKLIMKAIMKAAYIIFILTIVSVFSFGQNSRFYQSIKSGVYTEYAFAPAYVSQINTFTNINPVTGIEEQTTEYLFNNKFTFSILNIAYSLRYNITDISDNIGIGLNVSPSLGFTISEEGFGSANLPAYLSFNFGAGSTYSTSANFGGFAGVGYEFTKIHLFSFDDGFAEPEYTDIEKPVLSWAQPMVICGIRWWNKRNRLKELSIKYGFGSNSHLPSAIDDSGAPTPATFQINWGWFINY